jgi:hypothetical protein
MSTSAIGTGDPHLAQKPAATTARATSGFLARPVGSTLSLGVLLAIAILRIVSTYHVFNHTIDEPSHIAGGIEWWEKGTYTLEPKHTPLARISVALGPYLTGVRGTGATVWQETYPILSENGKYWRNLILGRIGVLPYFVIATLVVFIWTKRLFGPAEALLAAAIFTQLPTILAHSSNATTDVALTAMFCWAAYALTLWLREPNMRTGAHFGLATGLALATKLSTLVFLPACAAPILLMYARSGQARWRALGRTVAIAAVCAFLALWAVYRFSHVPLAQATHLPDRAASKVFGPSSRMAKMVHEIAVHVPVPAPEFFDGIRMLRKQNREGSKAYLFGRVRDGGWWYFFFAAVALKTPLAVLLLAAIGSVAAWRRYRRNRVDWEILAPLAAFVMIMIATIPSHLDSGVRYVLPVFVFLSMLAAFGLATLWEHRRRVPARAVAILLFAWLAVSSAWSHPDYLAYFNELGGRDPSHLIVVGDLDWGQDYTRLSTYLRDHSIKHISIVPDNLFEPAVLGLPETELVPCHGEKPVGWVAVQLRRARLRPECFPWLPQQHAVATVGKTMTIYYVQ